MSPPKRVVLAITASACAVLAGCTETGTPVATETSVSTSSTSAHPDASGAPPIENPIEAGRYLADPCQLFTEQELASFGLGKQFPVTTSNGPNCAWRDAENRALYGVVFNEGNVNGLSDIYRGNKEGKLAYFEPTTVNGYPAAVADGGTDDRPDGWCNVFVGMNPGMAFNVSVAGGDPATACSNVQKIASSVVDKLKES
ncbi:DUF3558 domain-containing protein [Actinokineospora pegani]|uniref:DUF3558 domain-containing protein n=1 Tax=Actinokineospora pegani TaxID=2654637 RepID=UPI0012E9B9AF|nr:DUF3558 domain-containing protein [Actinokineospora pegani]